EGRRPKEPGRRAALVQSDRVVETPRRARPSVGGAGEDDVARLRQLVDQLGRRRRGGVGLLAMDDGGHAVALAQQRAEVADEAVEVRLGVVEEADGAAVPA